MILENQLELFDKSFINSKDFRPIHYLGSKLRILDSIKTVIDEIDPNGKLVCDLFTGSGSVAYSLSKSRQVIAVDIQEYSKVICSTLLNPVIPDESSIRIFIDSCQNSKHSKKMKMAVKPLVDYEESVTKKAILEQDLIGLSDLLENGSIIGYELKNQLFGSSNLYNCIDESLKKFSEQNLGDIDVLTFKQFGGLYFSYKQAAQIDIILNFIHEGHTIYKNFFLTALLSTVSDCVNTVGKQFAQPIRPRNASGDIKPSLGKTVQKDRNLDVLIVFQKWIGVYANIDLQPSENFVLKMDYTEALKRLPKDTSVVYADPPYTRDHYSRYYHVLETIALRDFPEISTNIVKGRKILSRGIYRIERHQSPFCIKSQAPGAFELLISGSRDIGSKLIISYSPYDNQVSAHPRVVTMSQLEKIAKKYYSHVDIQSVGTFVHSKLNHSRNHLDASVNAEQLIICQ